MGGCNWHRQFVEAPLNNGLRMDKAAEDFYQYLLDPKAGGLKRSCALAYQSSSNTFEHSLDTWR